MKKNFQLTKNINYGSRVTKRKSYAKIIPIVPLMPRGYSAIQRKNLREYEKQILAHNKIK